jgi:hypothetical protein
MSRDGLSDEAFGDRYLAIVEFSVGTLLILGVAQ